MSPEPPPRKSRKQLRAEAFAKMLASNPALRKLAEREAAAAAVIADARTTVRGTAQEFAMAADRLTHALASLLQTELDHAVWPGYSAEEIEAGRAKHIDSIERIYANMLKNEGISGAPTEKETLIVEMMLLALKSVTADERSH